MGRSIGVLACALGLVGLASLAPAQQTAPVSAEECKAAVVLVGTTVPKHGLGGFSPRFLRSFERYATPDHTCRGPRVLDPETYHDVALWELFSHMLAGSKLDLNKHQLTIPAFESGRPLPIGNYTLGPAITSNKALTEAEFKQSVIERWLMSYQLYNTLRGKGFSNLQIAQAAEDVYAQGFTDFHNVGEIIALNKIQPQARPLMICLIRRQRMEIRLGKINERVKCE